MGTPTIPRISDRLVLSDGTVLPVAAVADGEYLRRSSGTVAGGTPAGGVSSVFGRTGAVTAQAGDYSGIYQPTDAELTALAGLTSAADKGLYFTGSGAAATFDLSAIGRTMSGKASLEAVKAYLGIPRWYDVVATDWVSDAAAGSGGVWDFLTDGTTSPSGWTYQTTAGAAPTIMRLNADGSLQCDETPSGANWAAQVYKDFAVLDSALWPFFAADWTADGDLYAATDYGLRGVDFRNSAGTSLAQVAQRKGAAVTNSYINYNISGGSSSSTNATASSVSWAVAGYRAAMICDRGSFDVWGGATLAPVHHWSPADSAGVGSAGTDRKWLGGVLGSSVRFRVWWNSTNSWPRIRDKITALKVYLGN